LSFFLFFFFLFFLNYYLCTLSFFHHFLLPGAGDQEGGAEWMVESGNMATVTTKYSHPIGRLYGLEVGPKLKFKRSVPWSVVRRSTSSTLPCSGLVEVGSNGFTAWRSICTICPTM
jgi:hypothetical protein